MMKPWDVGRVDGSAAQYQSQAWMKKEGDCKRLCSYMLLLNCSTDIAYAEIVSKVSNKTISFPLFNNISWMLEPSTSNFLIRDVILFGRTSFLIMNFCANNFHKVSFISWPY